MPNILHLLPIHATPDRIYEALTTAEGVRSWWTRDADLDATEGGVGEFRFYGGRVTTRIVIATLDPAKRVAWRVTESSAPGGWVGTMIGFETRPEDEGAILSFAHRGFAEESDGFARVTTGWAYFLVSLKQYLETGSGAPAPDVDFARLIG